MDGGELSELGILGSVSSLRTFSGRYLPATSFQLAVKYHHTNCISYSVRGPVSHTTWLQLLAGAPSESMLELASELKSLCY